MHVQYGTVFDEATDLQAELKKIPVIDLALPTMVLIGSPNVGKSSIIRSISSGVPEVNNYPFTTRGMTLGHLEVRDQVYQIMDSPGLLDRSDDDRNEMELLTIASLAVRRRYGSMCCEKIRLADSFCDSYLYFHFYFKTALTDSCDVRDRPDWSVR